MKHFNSLTPAEAERLAILAEECAEVITPTKELHLEGGCYYLNGRGDRMGPMDELASGIWVDQYGTWYAPNGRQFNHVEASTGNLVAKVDPWTREACR